MVDYQLADPRAVCAVYRQDAPLAGRDILLKIRFAGMRFNVGVRVGEVYDESRQLDGRDAQVFGWYYQTLDGHFEEGRMHYELWKWLDTGDVEFRLHAFSRAAQTGPFVLRTGFRPGAARDAPRASQRRVTRVVIDPGVLVSAFISPKKSAPALLVDAILDGTSMCSCPPR